jgi:hypothetical protein
MRAPRRHPAKVTVVWGALFRIEGEDEAAMAAGREGGHG